MIEALLRAFARLPLRWVHAIGAALGWSVYLPSPGDARRMRGNLRQSALATDEDSYRKLLHGAIAEAGKSFVEVLAVWLRDEAEVTRLVVECKNIELGLAAKARGKGVVFLTPHLGCFEICALYAAR